MPHLFVPLTRNPPSSEKLKISYTLRGHGPILVLLVPGMCVSSVMFDAMGSFLAATSQFTAIAIDNRGIGQSHVPYASLFRAPGYTASELAQDAWDVIDHLTSPKFQPQVALIGHSMGGMVVQNMLSLRPNRVKYVALLATHAGGLWNMLPTLRLLTSALRVVWSGFDRHVHAAVNLSLHFTQRFLDDFVGLDDFPTASIHSLPNDTAHSSHLHPHSHPFTLTSIKSPVPNTLRRRRSSNRPSRSRSLDDDPQTSSQLYSETPSTDRPSSFYRGVNFVESKVIEFARDAHIYFGISVSSLPRKYQHPQQFLLDAVVRRAKRYRARRRRRWDIYLARYTGQDSDPDEQQSSSSSPHVDSSDVDDELQQHIFNSAELLSPFSSSSENETAQSSSIQTVEKEEHSESPKNNASSTKQNTIASKSQNSSSPSIYSYFGHIAVVRSHYLSCRFTQALRKCTALVKLVVIGRHDSVVAPSSSRALANAIDANTVVELDAAHFVTDEAAAEVTTHIVYGLRKAFFAPVATPCTCSLCSDPIDQTLA